MLQLALMLILHSISVCCRAVYINIPGLVGLLVLTVCCGLVIYANYKGCDPIELGVVKSADQVHIGVDHSLLLYIIRALTCDMTPGLF